jgi:hypothetical protein
MTMIRRSGNPEASRPPFAITHAPGHMFITDVPDTDYRVETS